MADDSSIRRYRSNVQDEVDSAALYRAMAKAESNSRLKQVYDRLAMVEEAHAEFWKNRLAGLGAADAGRGPGWRSRALSWLARRLGPDTVLPIINAMERTGGAGYDSQPEAVLAGLPAAERSHARIVQAMAGSSTGGISGGALARIEGRHRTGSGNALRAAVLGANDGLVSNLSLVTGVIGADLAAHAVLLTGIAGLIAGACSMGMGEWLSVTSAREFVARQLATEADELAEFPEEEKQELALIYEAKGMPEAEAKRLAERIIGNAETALDTLAREELGIDPVEMGGSPWLAAASSFLLFAVGAAVPVVPLFFFDGIAAAGVSAGLSAAAMFAIGAGATLYTGRSVLYSGGRQLAIGIAAAAITFGLGRLIGAVVGG
ncbi:MAG: VIT1/CCC1 transporter family protein [Stellaceae bacterium]